jgi:hypothetical protein
MRVFYYVVIKRSVKCNFSIEIYGVRARELFFVFFFSFGQSTSIREVAGRLKKLDFLKVLL